MFTSGKLYKTVNGSTVRYLCLDKAMEGFGIGHVWLVVSGGHSCPTHNGAIAGERYNTDDNGIFAGGADVLHRELHGMDVLI